VTIRLRPPYLHRALDATSQWLNTVFLNGDANESISGRAHREGWQLGNAKWLRRERIINTLFFWEPEHCYWAWLNDQARAEEILKGT
jgi:hypothetical protein